jgi:hypothetical protein
MKCDGARSSDYPKVRRRHRGYLILPPAPRRMATRAGAGASDTSGGRAPGLVFLPRHKRRRQWSLRWYLAVKAFGYLARLSLCLCVLSPADAPLV